MKYDYEVRYVRPDGSFGAYSGVDFEDETFAKEAYKADVDMCERCGYQYTATIKKSNK